MNVNVLIAFYSRTGSAEALAKAIAECANSAGATVRLRRARELVQAEIMKSCLFKLDETSRSMVTFFQ
jgi:NAD(P)H dehydrogenase (quinone)